MLLAYPLTSHSPFPPSLSMCAVTAVNALANIVKSSLGPVGLDKMLVDEVGDVTITNDGATILKLLEVEHPAAKVLVELAALQDQEVGDGTTSVVILAAELLRQGNELVRSGLHPTLVISGYNLAKRECCKFIAEHMAQQVSELGMECIVQSAKTSMSSKIIGAESEFFAKLAVDAVTAVKTSGSGSKGKVKYPIKSINILKAHGQSMKQSQLVNGYALNCTRAAQGMPTFIRGAKIALLDFDLRKMKLPLGVQVVVSDVQKLSDIRQREGDITKERIELILDAGANVVLTSQGIDDMMLKYFVERGVMAVRRVDKGDLRSIAKVTGGQVLLSLADLEGNESIEAGLFGEAESVEEARVGDGELIYIKGCSTTRAQTIILRGANDYMLDEIERSLHDALCVVKRVLESKTVVPGGGAVEAALSVYMESLAETMGSREQLAVSGYAQALLVLPKTLCVNGAQDATELVSKLRAYHNRAQMSDSSIQHGGGKTAEAMAASEHGTTAATNGQLNGGKGGKDYRWYGLDLEEGRVRDNVAAGVLEPAMSKIKMIRFATEAAITILRIDDAIKMNPTEKPDRPVHDGY